MPIVKVVGVTRRDLGLSRAKKDMVKESKDSVNCMQIFGSIKEVVPQHTPSTIKKEIQSSLHVPFLILIYRTSILINSRREKSRYPSQGHH